MQVHHRCGPDMFSGGCVSYFKECARTHAHVPVKVAHLCKSSSSGALAFGLDAVLVRLGMCRIYLHHSKQSLACRS